MLRVCVCLVWCDLSNVDRAVMEAENEARSVYLGASFSHFCITELRIALMLVPSCT